MCLLVIRLMPLLLIFDHAFQVVPCTASSTTFVFSAIVASLSFMALPISLLCPWFALIRSSSSVRWNRPFGLVLGLDVVPCAPLELLCRQ